MHVAGLVFAINLKTLYLNLKDVLARRHYAKPIHFGLFSNYPALLTNRIRHQTIPPTHRHHLATEAIGQLIQIAHLYPDKHLNATHEFLNEQNAVSNETNCLNAFAKKRKEYLILALAFDLKRRHGLTRFPA